MRIERKESLVVDLNLPEVQALLEDYILAEEDIEIPEGTELEVIYDDHCKNIVAFRFQWEREEKS
jgi:hypothetical protein